VVSEANRNAAFARQPRCNGLRLGRCGGMKVNAKPGLRFTAYINILTSIHPRWAGINLQGDL